MSTRRARRAFTLMEMVVAMVVTAIIAGIGVGAVRGVTRQFNQSRAKSTANEVVIAERTFAGAWDEYASSEDDLHNLSRSITVVGPQTESTDNRTASVAVSNVGTLTVSVAFDGGCTVRRLAPLQAGSSDESFSLPAGTPCTGSAALPVGETAITPIQHTS